MADELVLTSRAHLVGILVAHQRSDITSCICGWGKLGSSHCEHVADMVQAASN